MLHEWGLGGRRFGTVVTWFLIGGDLYTAYTFIAVPALAFGAGAVAFFAVPYTIVAYPIFFLVFPRIWHVCHKHHYITAGDFVRGRFGNRWLALAVTITGIVATMPYIALQLVGLAGRDRRARRLGHGVCGRPAADHRIRDPGRLHLFERSARARLDRDRQGHPDLSDRLRGGHRHSDRARRFRQDLRRGPAAEIAARDPGPNTTGAYSAYATLAFGSALALFLYPHSMTGILSASSGHAVRRNAALLPGYSFMLGLLALVGFFAIAAGVASLPEYAAGFKQFGNNFAVPALFLHSFPSWFVGIAFAAIGIGALVPAAIMSIAAANLYTRNIHREFINRNPTDKQEAQMAKWVSLIVKFGALVFIIFVPTQYAI